MPEFGQDNCGDLYSPKQGGVSNNWDHSRAVPFRRNYEFQANGNDIYLAVFGNSTSNYSHMIVISGWNDNDTAVFRNGDINDPICTVQMAIANVKVLNNFTADFDIQNKVIKLSYNGKQYLNCTDPQWKPTNTPQKFVFSQYGTNVQVCSNIKQSCYSPKQGGNYNNWDNSMIIPYKRNFEFMASGNDIYLGVFGNSSRSNYTHMIVISGWSDKDTAVFRNGDINDPICTVQMAIADVNIVNMFKVDYNPVNQVIELWYDGKQYLNCTDPQWTANNYPQKFIFSQYGTNVQICNNHKLSWRRSQNSCKVRYSPRQGGYYNKWDHSMAIPYSKYYEFEAKGNDIYLADFDNSTSNYTHLIVISGWNDNETAVYRNGDIVNAICAMNMHIDNVNATNNFRVAYDIENSLIKLWSNGVQYLNCYDPLWKKATYVPKSKTRPVKRRFVFSQFGKNVEVCAKVHLLGQDDDYFDGDEY